MCLAPMQDTTMDGVLHCTSCHIHVRMSGLHPQGVGGVNWADLKIRCRRVSTNFGSVFISSVEFYAELMHKHVPVRSRLVSTHGSSQHLDEKKTCLLQERACTSGMIRYSGLHSFRPAGVGHALWPLIVLDVNN